MKELAHHILDIANNSVRGKATEIKVKVTEDMVNNILIICIDDNGVGIPPEVLKTIKDPFTTSRTMRKVGLGIPLLNDTCSNCEGELIITSMLGEGTDLIATMKYNHIDRPPLGNMSSTMTTLITSEEHINMIYSHKVNDLIFEVSTKELKEILGDISLSEVEVILWLKEYIRENLEEIRNG